MFDTSINWFTGTAAATQNHYMGRSTGLTTSTRQSDIRNKVQDEFEWQVFAIWMALLFYLPNEWLNYEIGTRRIRHWSGDLKRIGSSFLGCTVEWEIIEPPPLRTRQKTIIGYIFIMLLFILRSQYVIEMMLKITFEYSSWSLREWLRCWFIHHHSPVFQRPWWVLVCQTNSTIERVPYGLEELCWLVTVSPTASHSLCF